MTDERRSGRYTPLHSSIWSDPDFLALSANAQRVYLLAISQPNVSFAGVVPYTEKRWAGMASDTTRGCVADGLNELEDARFVSLDEDSEELLVRSFVKHNRIWEQKQLHKALVKAYGGILSTRLRRSFYDEQTEEVKALLGSPPPASMEPASSLPEGRSEGTGLTDLDLNQQPQPGEAASDRGAQARALMAPGCSPQLLDEAVMVLDSFGDTYPVADVEAAVQKLLDDRRRFPFPSDLRRAMTNLLGPPKGRATDTRLDEAQRAQYQAAAQGLEQVRSTLNDPDYEQDPEARRAVLDRLRGTEHKAAS